VPQATGNKRDEAKLHANENGKKMFSAKESENKFIFAKQTYLPAAKEKVGSSINRIDSPKWSRRKFKI